MRTVSLFFVICAITTFIGCGTTAYIIPNNKEYTTGGIFADKYWSSFSGGKNVQLEGQCSNVTTSVLDGDERLLFSLTVPGGLRPISVYADRKFASQLYDLAGHNVVVYGKTLSVQSHSREDQGFVGAELSVELHRIEPAATESASPTSAAKQNKCPPTGTIVPFARLENPAYNADYVGCKVTTTAKFLNINNGMVTLPKSVTDTHVIFNATDINETTKAGVGVQKQAADILFELKPKDTVTLTGENRIVQYGTMDICFFDAESVNRAP